MSSVLSTAVDDFGSLPVVRSLLPVAAPKDANVLPNNVTAPAAADARVSPSTELRKQALQTVQLAHNGRKIQFISFSQCSIIYNAYLKNGQKYNCVYFVVSNLQIDSMATQLMCKINSKLMLIPNSVSERPTYHA